MEYAEKKVRISKDEVVAKLKDDGDFDRLRLKIIRKLKEDEQLRENISAVVKQSDALNRLGAENLKPRQLSDSIYQEVGENVMNQISDGLWGIIRSSDGMKDEITETVQSVYYKLMNPKGNSEIGSSIPTVMPAPKETGSNGSLLASASEVNDVLSDMEPNEPPGFSLPLNHPKDTNKDLALTVPHDKGTMEEQHNGSDLLQDKLENNVAVHSQPPGSANMEHEQPDYSSDQDPDVPPGFG